jgi:hypothetical protein
VLGLLLGYVAQRQQFMEHIARNEKSPTANVESSFVTIKWWVAEAYYTSKIGIHDELEYKGNRILQEYVGCDDQGPATK